MKTNFRKISILTSILVLSTLGLSAVAANNKGDNFVDVTSMNNAYEGNEKESTEVYPEIKDLYATSTLVYATTIEDDGEHLYGWGRAKEGELGPNYNEEAASLVNSPDHITPVQIMFEDWAPDWKFIDVEQCGQVALALIEDSTGTQHLYGWGQNHHSVHGASGEYYSLLYGYPAEIISTPVELDLSYFNNERIIDMDVSGQSAIVVTEGETSDHLYTWGSNVRGATGNGITEGSTDVPTEITLPGITNFKVDTLEGGFFNWQLVYDARMIISVTDLDTDTESVYVWGSEENSSFGVVGDANNDTARFFYEPTLIIGGLEGDVEEIVFGQETTDAIYKDTEGNYSLWQWGYNRSGHINGLPIGERIKEPTMTLTTEGTEYNELSHINTGSELAFVVASNTNTGQSDIYGWGKNYWNMLLQEPSQTEEVFTATLIDTSKYIDGNVEYIDTENDTTFAIVNEADAQGQLYTWGTGNILGRIGEFEMVDGHDISVPVKVQFSSIIEEEESEFPWWIIFAILTAIGIIIILLMLWEIHLDHGEKHEHHWLHIGRHHE